MSHNTNRFARERFGAGEEGERLAHQALLEHESRLIPGTHVRVRRANCDDIVGTIVGETSGSRCYAIRSSVDGLVWNVESRNIELDEVQS